MISWLRRNLSIDLHNLPPLPDERNTMNLYLDVPDNYYIPDGKNSCLLQMTNRQEFDRKTPAGNKVFVLQIPFLDCAFNNKHFVVDKVTGDMLGIYDGKLEEIQCSTQLQCYNLAQLQRAVYVLKQ